MCSVTFIPDQKGFILGMNRDEKLTRARAVPPAFCNLEGCRALFPAEPGGGTWIGSNEHGVTLSLLNCYSVQDRVAKNLVSRGKLVRSLLSVRSQRDLQIRLAQSELTRVNPFRLVAIFPREESVTESRWDLSQLRTFPSDWQPAAWFSSGFDEPAAQRSREQVFREALREGSSSSVPLLRRLHASHQSGPGPYSYCMHRADAATVSYTEVVYWRGYLGMTYFDGAPCEHRDRASPKERSPRLTSRPLSGF